MDDLRRPPGDRDRDRVVERIKRVFDEGRISAADRDIRLRNVRSAQSMTEVDLMSRDLDQLEAALGPAGVEPTGGAPESGQGRRGARSTRDPVAAASAPAPVRNGWRSSSGWSWRASWSVA